MANLALSIRHSEANLFQNLRFALKKPLKLSILQGSVCCGYGSLGTKTSGYDCVMIPGATKAADKAPVPNSICGQGKGLVTLSSGMVTATVCSELFFFSSAFFLFLKLNLIERISFFPFPISI